MKLLILTQKVDKDDTNLGFFCSWIREFARHAEAVLVLSLQKGAFDLPSNVSVMSLGKETNPSRLRYVWNFYKTIWGERNAYDAVFVHMNPEYVILGGPLWRLWNKKILFWYTHKAVNVRLWLAQKFATKIFTASKESFRLRSRKVEVTGHGIDVSEFRMRESLRPGEEIRLLWVGRISPVKDLETTVRAIGFLQRDGGRYSLNIVGTPTNLADEEYQKTILELIHTLSLDERVHLLGGLPHAQMPRVYASHHALIHTSRTGSVDKVVLEALSAGLTVFSSNDAIASFGSLVIQFPANDSEKLAEVIEKSSVSAILEPNMKGREFVQNFHSLSRLIDRILRYVDVQKGLDRHSRI